MLTMFSTAFMGYAKKPSKKAVLIYMVISSIWTYPLPHTPPILDLSLSILLMKRLKMQLTRRQYLRALNVPMKQLMTRRQQRPGSRFKSGTESTRRRIADYR